MVKYSFTKITSSPNFEPARTKHHHLLSLLHQNSIGINKATHAFETKNHQMHTTCHLYHTVILKLQHTVLSATSTERLQWYWIFFSCLVNMAEDLPQKCLSWKHKKCSSLFSLFSGAVWGRQHRLASWSIDEWNGGNFVPSTQPRMMANQESSRASL